MIDQDRQSIHNARCEMFSTGSATSGRRLSLSLWRTTRIVSTPFNAQSLHLQANADADFPRSGTQRINREDGVPDQAAECRVLLDASRRNVSNPWPYLFSGLNAAMQRSRTLAWHTTERRKGLNQRACFPASRPFAEESVTRNDSRYPSQNSLADDVPLFGNYTETGWKS